MRTLAPNWRPALVNIHAITALRLATIATLTAACAACGGGTVDTVLPADRTHTAQAGDAAEVTTVQFEGCVLDQYFIPNEGVPVRVLSSDGRLLANSRSGKLGAFSVRLPAEAAIVLQVDAANGESLSARTQRQDQVFATCLVARVV